MACHPGLAAVPVSRGRDHSNRFLSSQSRTSSASTDDLTGGARRSGIFRHGIALAAASMTSAPAFGVAARSDVRWVELGGLRIEGDPEFWFTARRWTTEELDAAAHLTDLAPGDTVWVNLDHGQHGIGSQSCGPGPLPQYVLSAAPAEFSFVFSETA